MQRITNKQLEALADWINDLTSNPKEPYSKDAAGRLRANVGNYHVSYAYGGACLHQMANDAGGVKTPVVHGHVPRRQLFEMMHAYINGLRDQKEKL